ncbi:hypothetical protein BVY03_01565 [bacterium K02(2017)]|nr:hypothetical protein BVY03_01565 [bacterium K02(2017)]
MTDSPLIYLICGNGGVGKTTVSAALGLKFAQQNKKAIVLTIDPAKRLADSLGIKGLSDEPQKISFSKTKKNQGELWAMMLDTKRTFDRLIEKYAPSAEAKQRIINNKLYQHMSQMLAGTQEYMAMERLYEIYKQNTFDVIIVDTPPMQNAVDFLAAPQKMMNMINNSMLHLLLKPTLSIGKSGFKLFERGSRQILKVFDRITGFAFLQDLSEMAIAFKDLLSGFETRATQVNQLLKREGTSFVIVCTTNQNSINEVDSFYKQLKENKYDLSGIIANRVYHANQHKLEINPEAEKQLNNLYSKQETEILINNYKKYIPLIKRDKKQIKILNEIIGSDMTQTIPLYLTDVHDLKTLGVIAQEIDL